MRNYAELAAGLRYCSTNEPCEKCPYYRIGSDSCFLQVRSDAADAIEELLAKLDELWIQLHVEGRSLIDDYDFYKRFKMLGNDHIDRPGWERWENELQAERVRRKEETK